ncbi:MAG: DUF2721 domain-containing protein [Deferribacterota bacterium]|nr:DUF2721 domain-containing protein [Deferribacterota bacterium]
MSIVGAIQTTLAPLFLVNGIALFNLVQQNRYARTSDRLTALIIDGSDNSKSAEFTYLAERIFLIRTSMLFVYISILLALLASIFILPTAFTKIINLTNIIYYTVAILFSLSLISFLIAVITAIIEVRLSYLYYREKINNLFDSN